MLSTIALLAFALTIRRGFVSVLLRTFGFNKNVAPDVGVKLSELSTEMTMTSVPTASPIMSISTSPTRLKT